MRIKQGDRTKVNDICVGVTMNSSLRDRADAYGATIDRNRSWVVRRALEEFLANHAGDGGKAE